MSVTLEFRQIGDVTVVDAVGKIIMGESAVMLRDGIRELIDRGKNKIILNMAGVSRIDSYSVNELTSALTTASNKKGGFKLLNLTKRIKDLLQIFRMYTVFETFDSEEEAVASFN